MPDVSAKYVLVGGGVACVWAAMGIREHDKEGSILMIRDEPHMPYDRPPLSKNFIFKPEVTLDDITSKLDSFYPENSIEILHGTAEKLDTKNKTVRTAAGQEIGYEKLLIATGSQVVPLDAPGGSREGVFHIHTVDDAEALRQAMATAKTAVLVGGGYISLEAGSQMVKRGIETTIVTQEVCPWGHFVSNETGNFLRRYFEAKGVQFIVGEIATSVMTGPIVVTGSGARIEADLVVVGIGVTPRTDLATGGGLEADPRHGVYVDETLKTSDADVYAAGDVAYFYDRLLGKRWRADHHLNAKWQGKLAGENMAGAEKPYEQVAYFFSDMFDLHMALRGDAEFKGETTIFGNVDDAEFVEVYCDDGGEIKKAIAFSRDDPKLDKISDKLEELIRGKARVSSISAETFAIS
jgi:3-phenylpropionate/trans-cinnamate dioxygenase ferredoxin reductase component